MTSGANWSAAFGEAAVSAMQVYDEVMVPRLFAPWAELLVDRLEIQPGEAVLDVACGPGSVTRIAAARSGAGGRVIGCDLSAAMLAVAGSKPAPEGAAPIEYREAAAERLPVGDAEFDVATCQQGLQFFPDRPAALAEMHRALRPGGRLGVAVWAEIPLCPPFAAIGDALEEVAGAELADRYRGGPWGFPDGARLEALVREAGFEDVRVSREVLPLSFEGGGAQLFATLAATPLAAEIGRFPEDQKRGLSDAIARRLGGGAIESHAESNVALARQPTDHV
ncbi:MAG TPA: class I SAM-dependent methyltransferase [Solirubrobacteraceae bacterium]|nr:class I SAM-dependent methyltransferase [Solirubrobacteraceae bacterium]